MLGYTEAEMLGQSADIVFTPEDRATRAPPTRDKRIVPTSSRLASARTCPSLSISMYWPVGEGRHHQSQWHAPTSILTRHVRSLTDTRS
jgi:hypothetical protein